VNAKEANMWNKIKAVLGLGDSPEVAAAKARTLIDTQDARKRFVFGMLSLSYEADPAYLTELATTAMREWYGIGSSKELRERIEFYLEGTGSTPGYDAYRAAFMARAGHGAGLASEVDSWEWALRAARKAQQSYPGWTQFAMGYLEGHLAYRKSEGDTDEALVGYRNNIMARIRDQTNGLWAQTPFQTPL
jgi:hypothetical protein